MLRNFVHKRHILILGVCVLLLGIMVPLASFAKSASGSLPSKVTQRLVLKSQNDSGAASSSIKTVFIIMMENTNWATIVNNPSAPYINQTLIPHYAHANNYLSKQHPSLPNYITLEAGSNLGLTNGKWLPTDHSVSTTNHLTTFMRNNGISWSYFAENLPGNGTICNLSDPGTPYSEDHNPFAYFQDVSGNPPSTSTSYCIQHERPYSEFLTDLQNATVPQYNFIVPNDWDQGEKYAPGSKCKLCQAVAGLNKIFLSFKARAHTKMVEQSLSYGMKERVLDTIPVA